MKRTQALLAAVVAAGALCGCSDPKAATKALDDMGFTFVETTGYRLFGCGEDYTFHTGFVAMNPKGKRVSGVVCSGWLKGSSVKFD